jgi:hypothetical protein
MFEKILELKFSINWLRWIIYSAILLVVAYIVFPKWHDPLVYAAAVLGGIGVLISAMNDIEVRREQIEADRVHHALQFQAEWINPNFYHAKSKSREVLQHIEKNGHANHEYITERLQNMMDVLNYFETMSIAIDIGHADEKIVKRFFRGMVVEYWQVAEPWIKNRRAEKKNPRLLCEFEKLASRWGQII